MAKKKVSQVIPQAVEATSGAPVEGETSLVDNAPVYPGVPRDITDVALVHGVWSRRRLTLSCGHALEVDLAEVRQAGLPHPVKSGPPHPQPGDTFPCAECAPADPQE